MNTVLTTSLRIGIIRTSSIGDVILASACLSMAKDLGVEVVWLGREPTLDLLVKAHPHAKFYKFKDSSANKTLAAISSKFGPLSGLVDLQVNFRSRLLVHQAKKQGLPVITAKKFQLHRVLALTAARARQRLFRRQYAKVPQTLQFLIMLDAMSELLVKLGVSPKLVAQAKSRAHPDLSFFSRQEISAPWGHELKFGHWIALAPGAAHATKQAPNTVWFDVFDDLKSKIKNPHDVGLLFVGGEADRKMAITIADEIAWPGPLLNLAGKITLSETAAALGRTALLLTNDSGLLHIAEAVGTPVAALFGPTSEEFGFSPWKKESLSCSATIGCRPCSKHGKQACRFDDKLCFESINTKAISLFTLTRLNEVRL